MCIRDSTKPSVTKLKRPMDLVLSSLRALNADTDGVGPLRHLGLMGQVPFQWAMPDGYPDSASAWSGSLLARWNFAVALATGGIGNTKVDLDGIARAARAEAAGAQVDSFSVLLLGRHMAAPARIEILRLVTETPGQPLQKIAASLLVSPEFQWR